MRSIIYVYGLIICIIDVKLGKTANQYKKSDIFWKSKIRPTVIKPNFQKAELNLRPKIKKKTPIFQRQCGLNVLTQVPLDLAHSKNPLRPPILSNPPVKPACQ